MVQFKDLVLIRKRKYQETTGTVQKSLNVCVCAIYVHITEYGFALKVC